MPAEGSLVANGAAAEIPSGMVAMLAFVGGYYNCRIFGGSLHSLLDCAFAIRATVVAPRIWAVFHSLLSVFSPAVPIFKMINFTLSHERKSRLLYSLLSFLSNFIPVEAHQP